MTATDSCIMRDYYPGMLSIPFLAFSHCIPSHSLGGTWELDGIYKSCTQWQDILHSKQFLLLLKGNIYIDVAAACMNRNTDSLDWQLDSSDWQLDGY